MQVNIMEAKSCISKLIKAAEAGEEVVTANRGQPVVRLVAMAPVGKARSAGRPARILAWKQRTPLPPHLRRSAEKIDAEIEAERNAWN
ncbi:MAG TPA: hypothetical protein VHX61_04170 [Rhizomicrobium sp.]|jgi:antitoxin (DNA-binding transcriptional repressor) of toxin-antitoxin stability system|nr:hypothetical protein [Rhizomicrobium sp.]